MVFAIDLGARTIAMYRREIATGTLVLAHTISGIPVGNWTIALQDARPQLGTQIVLGVPGPVGFNAWETTV